jgi:hypothetical protein
MRQLTLLLHGLDGAFRLAGSIMADISCPLTLNVVEGWQLYALNMFAYVCMIPDTECDGD